MTHPYSWEDVREVPARSLAVGDVFVKPGMGAAYYTSSDGRVRGAGLVHAMPLDGTAWTVTAREGGATTCRAEDGREATAAIPEHAHVLRVLTPGRGE
jgi:hypothetical protein